MGPAAALSLETARDELRALAAATGGLRMVGSGAALLAVEVPEAMAVDLAGPAPEALARLAAAADPVASSPRPLYLRAPDATPPSRLPGQPRPAPGAA